MKKFLTAVAMALLLVGCTRETVDLSGINEKLAELDNRVSALEGAVAAIQSAIGDGVFVQKVEQYADPETGKTVGVTVTYTSGKVVYFEITPKADYAGPVLSVIRSGDGSLVWAVDGIAIKDGDGNEVPVNKTPVFTLDDEGYLWVSIDGGDPVKLGQVQNEGATLVDGIFKDIKVEQDKVVLVLSDDSIVNIPFAAAFKLVIEQKEYVLENQSTITIPYTVTGKTANTVVGVAGYDPYYFYVEVTEENIKITPLQPDSEAVLLIYADSQVGLTSMVSVSVSRESAYVLDPMENEHGCNYMVESEGGDVEMHVVSNVEIEAKVDEAYSWISIVDTKARAYTISAKIAENKGDERYGYIYIYKKGTDKFLQTISVYQAKSTVDYSVDLSEVEAANSYIITAAGDYKFKAVKGNSAESVGTVDAVELLWETYNNAEEVEANSVIAKVGASEGFIRFSTPETLKPGNALIAAKDAEGKILWSWHIWIPKTVPTADFYGLSDKVKMMDRNLGALDVLSKDSPKAEDAGFFYQWGRKDPLRAVSSIEEGTMAKTAPAEVWKESSTQLTAANMHETPCVFIKGSEDWIDVSDKTLWGDAKTVNDPCPSGYKVPKRSETMLFDYLTPDETYKGWSVNDANYNYTIGKEATSYAVFPYGHFSRSGSYDAKSDGRAWMWTATNKSDSEMTQARTMVLNKTDPKLDCSGQKKANGAYVRCVVDPNAPKPEVPAVDLSEKATANCYVVSEAGKFKFKTVKGNSEESVGVVETAALVWETYNNAEEVTANSVIAEVSYADNYITFSTPETLKPGNALIAAKDAEGKILWSWHIWIPETPFTAVAYDYLSEGVVMMSRNLGALVDTQAGAPATPNSFGMLYQFGRKDPFPGASSPEATASVKLAGTAITVSADVQSVDDEIANPTVLTSKSQFTDPADWKAAYKYAWGDGQDKTVTDPCPPGYRVPLREDAKIFTKGNADLPSWNYDGTNAYFQVGTTAVSTLPLCGYLKADGTYGGAGCSNVWNAHIDGDVTDIVYAQVVSSDGTSKKGSTSRLIANSVRCVVDAPAAE